MNVETILKEYKVKKSYVESIIARIEQYKFMMNNPEMWDKDYLPPSRDLGMPSSKGGGGSWVEHYIIQKEVNENMIKQWIQKDESRVFFARMEVDQIERALSCLTDPEKKVIEWKYFNHMIWKDITSNYNDEFRADRPVTYETLKKKNKTAIDKLVIILEPFYNNC